LKALNKPRVEAKLKLDIVAPIAEVVRIVSFAPPFLMAFYVYNTAIDINRDGCRFAF